MKSDRWATAPQNWPATLMFVFTTAAAVGIVPWYGLSHGYSVAAWAWFAVFLTANELSITCGYHRLFAHAAYKARPALETIYLLFGGMAVQNSVLVWSAGHRAHHRYIDDPERDPYCARRGFWFSHIGWMLRNYPSGEPDLNCVRDLQRNPRVMWQHRNYLAVVLATNIGVPLLAGWASGDMLGTFLLAGVLRLVVSHHFTFFINSLAHIVGRQPYTDENTARDNAVVAVLTFGEGYHNFHHMFAEDFRNGVRWWQWDPSKWFITAMSWCGLATNLRRIPWFKIQRAKLDTQFRRAERQLACQPARAQVEQLRKRIAEEYEAFRLAVADWNQLREQWLLETRRTMSDRWQRSILQSRLAEVEHGVQLQIRRMRLLRAQIG